MVRIFIKGSRLVFQNNDNLQIDSYISADNFEFEKDFNRFIFYRKSDNKLLQTYLFSEILNEDGIAYVSESSFLDFLINFKTDVNNTAWGIPKVSLDKSKIHGLFTYNVPKTIWKETFNGTERTITNAISLNGKLNLTAGTVLNDKTVLDTFRNPRYEPNRGLIYSISAFLPSKNAVGERRFGIFTEESGVFFELINGVLSSVVRTKVNGVVSDDKKTIDLTNIDLEKGNTFDIQMQWRGVGDIKFFINQKKVSTFNYLGTRIELTEFNPANPICFECVNKGSDVIIECGCVDVSSEGGGINGKTYGSISVDNSSGQVAITDFNVPIIAVRSKKTVGTNRNTRDTITLFANAYSDQKSLLRIWQTRDFTAITANNQTWRDFGDGHLEFLVYDTPDVVTPMAFNTTKAKLIFGGRVGQDTTYTTTALFSQLTDVHLTPGDMFVFTMHRENGIAANVGVTFEFAEEI